MSPSNTLAYYMSLFGAVDFEGKRGKVNFLDFKASHTIVTLTKLVIHGILDNYVKTTQKLQTSGAGTRVLIGIR
jgi:hypothetical protein